MGPWGCSPKVLFCEGELEMAEFKCPLCKQNVSEELYQKITGIWKERRVAEKQFKEKQRQLFKQAKELKQRWLEEKRKFKIEQEQKIAEKIKKIQEEKLKMKEQFDKKILAAVRVAQIKAKRENYKELKLKMEELVKKQIGIATSKKEAEVKRISHTLEATRKQMSSLQVNSQRQLQINLKQQQKIADLEKQLKDKTTPQLEGLLYEDHLLEALKREFPEDKFEHTGKGGDIIQAIILDNKPIGTIVFECKRVGQWQLAHAEQAADAKIQRKADYALLVTNASKKGGGGFFVEKGVIVVHPGGVLAITTILREQILTIARMKLTHAQREEAIEKVFEYLQGAEFKNSIDIVIRKTIEMYEDLKRECQDHVKLWKKRYETLKLVHSNSAGVKVKATALIAGGKIQAEELVIQEFPALPDLTGA